MQLRITLDEDDLRQMIAADLSARYGARIVPGDLIFTCEGIVENTNSPRALMLFAGADGPVENL